MAESGEGDAGLGVISLFLGQNLPEVVTRGGVGSDSTVYVLFLSQDFRAEKKPSALRALGLILPSVKSGS